MHITNNSIGPFQGHPKNKWTLCSLESSFHAQKTYFSAIWESNTTYLGPSWLKFWKCPNTFSGKRTSAQILKIFIKFADKFPKKRKFWWSKIELKFLMTILYQKYWFILNSFQWRFGYYSGNFRKLLSGCLSLGIMYGPIRHGLRILSRLTHLCTWWKSSVPSWPADFISSSPPPGWYSM